jgi:hypothetical protein
MFIYHGDDMKKSIFVQVDANLYRQVKQTSAQNGQSLKGFVTLALKSSLQTKPQQVKQS